MATARLLVLDPAGLHARPAARFVRTASRFASRVTVRASDRTADAKSLIGLLTLTIRPGSEITIEADGPDESAAIEALIEELGGAIERVAE